jgi:hypothetical protein
MMSSVAITLTMYCGLILKTVEGVENQIHYRVTFDIFLIGINSMVLLYAIKLLLPFIIIRELCKSRKRKKERSQRGKQLFSGLSANDKKHKIVRSMSLSSFAVPPPSQKISPQKLSPSRSMSLVIPKEKSDLLSKCIEGRGQNDQMRNEKHDTKHGAEKVLPKTSTSAEKNGPLAHEPPAADRGPMIQGEPKVHDAFGRNELEATQVHEHPRSTSLPAPKMKIDPLSKSVSEGIPGQGNKGKMRPKKSTARSAAVMITQRMVRERKARSGAWTGGVIAPHFSFQQ